MQRYEMWFGLVAGLAALAAFAMGASVFWKMYKGGNESAEIESNWEARLHKLALLLSRIGPKDASNDPTWAQKPSYDPSLPAYEIVFPDPQFRTLLERFVVQADRKRAKFSPRAPRLAELRDPILRDTVAKAERVLAEFAQEHPAIAGRLEFQ
jgi:hypothetical protein